MLSAGDLTEVTFGVRAASGGGSNASSATTAAAEAEFSATSGEARRHLLKKRKMKVRPFLKGFRIKERRSGKDIYRGTPLPLRTVVYLMDVCNASAKGQMPFNSPDVSNIQKIYRRIYS